MRRNDARAERLLNADMAKAALRCQDLTLPAGVTESMANEDPMSSTSSIGLSGDVVPVHIPQDSFSRRSPRLNYLRVLSGRMVAAGLEPLEPPPQLVYAPPASVSGVLPAMRGDGSQKAGSIGMIFSLWNTMMGSTLLVMPYTFWEAGWLLALLLSISGALIAQFSCSLILHYAQGMMADPSAEFADLARLHFGEAGRFIAFFSGNFVVLGAAVAMHGYMANVLAHLIAYPPAHGGFCTAAAANAIGSVVTYVNSAVELPPPPSSQQPDLLQVLAGSAPPPPHGPRPSSGVSPCLKPLLDIWPAIHPHVPPPVLVCAVLIITLPLSNLPSIRLLARLNSVGVLCFMIILGFAYTSAAVAGVSMPTAFERTNMFKPASAGIVFGIFSLSFFIHNAVMTIMRGAARPRNNSRDLSIAYFLTWLCYASVGASCNICPPLQNLTALGSPEAKNGILSIEQPAKMAPLLIIARLAVLVQSMSVYPVLLFIIRSQVSSAFIWKRPYPGALPTLVMSTVMAAVTTAFTCLGVDIATVLKFAGAGGGLVCIYGLPALIHFFASRRHGTLTVGRQVVVFFLLSYGVFCLCMQLIPISPEPPHSNVSNVSNASFLDPGAQ